MGNRPCNRFQEADVQCVDGYYRRLARNPREKPTCLTCRPACPEPSHQVHPCQNFSNLGCCPGENYDYVIGEDGFRRCRERPWMCGRGQYLDSNLNDCKPCPEDTFMPEDYHSYTKCWDCQYLSDADLPLHAVILEPCSSTQSARYGCKEGYYVNHGLSYRGDDIGCSPCQTCDEGKYVGRECDNYSDTVCCDKPDMSVVDGPQGVLCIENNACNNGTYNPPACDKTCSQHCRGIESSDMSVCDPESGTCLNGCLDGYTGSTCEMPQHKKEITDGNGVDTSTIVLCVLVVIVIVVLTCVMYNKHCAGSGPVWWHRLVRCISAQPKTADAKDDQELQVMVEVPGRNYKKHDGDHSVIDDTTGTQIRQRRGKHETHTRRKKSQDDETALLSEQEKELRAINFGMMVEELKKTKAEAERLKSENDHWKNLLKCYTVSCGDKENYSATEENGQSSSLDPRFIKDSTIKQDAQTLEQIEKEMKSLVQDLLKMKVFHREDCEMRQRSINTFYIECSIFRKEICDLLASLDYAEICVHIMEDMHCLGPFQDDIIWSITYLTHNSCWNFSDESTAFAKSLADSGAIQLLAKNLDRDQIVPERHQKRNDFLVKATISILHNIARCTENRRYMSRILTQQDVEPLIYSDDDFSKTVAMMTFAYLVDEKDQDKLLDTTGVIKIIVEWLGESIKYKNKRTFQGCSAWELSQSLAKLAVNDRNKKMIIEEQALPKFLLMLQHTDPKEQISTMECILNLVQDRGILQTIKGFPELVLALESLQQSTDEKVKTKACEAASKIKGSTV